MSVKFDEKIRAVGQQLIQDYSNGILYGGINGPYDDPETKVRNLAHLCIMTSIEIMTYKKSEYVPLLNKMGDELMSLRDESGLYVMRQKAGKDICNGVIGHAWVNEALIYLWRVTNDDVYIDIAVDLSKRHAFNATIGLWGRPGQEATDDTIDYTFNHQLWYAATLAELNEAVHISTFEDQLDIFLEKLRFNFSTTKDGKVSHSIYRRLGTANSLKQMVKKDLNTVKEKMNKPSLAYKEEGYHVFNMMAFARLYRLYRKHSFFTSKEFKNAKNYMYSQKLLDGLENKSIEMDSSLHNGITVDEEKTLNIYGYTYNVPGFEILYVDEIFGGGLENPIVKQCRSRQFEYTYDDSTEKFGAMCHDKITINYRVYEYYRYLEMIG